MAFQTDVKATAALATTGPLTDAGTGSNVGRCRIKGLYLVSGSTAGSVAIANGSGGTTLLTVNTPVAANSGTQFILVPGEGILVETSLYGTVTNTASCVIFYG